MDSETLHFYYNSKNWTEQDYNVYITLEWEWEGAERRKEIVRRRLDGEKLKDLGREFGVTQGRIRQIFMGAARLLVKHYEFESRPVMTTQEHLNQLVNGRSDLHCQMTEFSKWFLEKHNTQHWSARAMVWFKWFGYNIETRAQYIERKSILLEHCPNFGEITYNEIRKRIRSDVGRPRVTPVEKLENDDCVPLHDDY